MPTDPHLRTILLYDPARRPRDWPDCLLPSEVAILISDESTGEELDRDGRLLSAGSERCCHIYSDLRAAEQFCRELTERNPRAKCEIFDRRGRAVEPLDVIVHPSLEKKEREDDPRRARVLIGAGLLAISVMFPLFYFDWTRSLQLIWPSLLAVNCFGLGLRLLFWGNGILQRQKKKLKSQAAAG